MSADNDVSSQIEGFQRLICEMTNEQLREQVGGQLAIATNQMIAFVMVADEMKQRGAKLSSGLNSLVQLFKQLTIGKARLSVVMFPESLDLQQHFEELSVDFEGKEVMRQNSEKLTLEPMLEGHSAPINSEGVVIDFASRSKKVLH